MVLPACRRTGPEPLLTLAGYRRSRGRITFGVLMNQQQQQQGSAVGAVHRLPAGNGMPAVASAGGKEEAPAVAPTPALVWLAARASVVAVAGSASGTC